MSNHLVLNLCLVLSTTRFWGIFIATSDLGDLLHRLRHTLLGKLRNTHRQETEQRPQPASASTNALSMRAPPLKRMWDVEFCVWLFRPSCPGCGWVGQKDKDRSMGEPKMATTQRWLRAQCMFPSREALSGCLPRPISFTSITWLASRTAVAVLARTWKPEEMM